MKTKMKTEYWIYSIFPEFRDFPQISVFLSSFLSSFSSSGAPAGGSEVGGRRNPARGVPEPAAGPQDAPWDHWLHALAPATLKTKMKTKMKTKIEKCWIFVFKTRFLKILWLIFKFSLRDLLRCPWGCPRRNLEDFWRTDFFLAAQFWPKQNFPHFNFCLHFCLHSHSKNPKFQFLSSFSLGGIPQLSGTPGHSF